MDDLTIGLTALPVAFAALIAATSAGVSLELAPAVAYRHQMRSLRADVQRLTDEHTAQAPHRRTVHCPACGRFATHVTTGPRGMWTRCKTHGVRLRVVKRVGRPERPLPVEPYRPLVALPVPEPAPLVPMIEAIRPTVRLADWLDGEMVA